MELLIIWPNFITMSSIWILNASNVGNGVKLHAKGMLSGHSLLDMKINTTIVPKISEYNHHTRYMEQYRKPPLYYIKTLEVGQHHTMDPIMEGILSCSLASSRGNPPNELQLPNTIILFISHYIA
jgi:hypothetical protein